MNCVSSAIELLKTNTCPALLIAVVAFALGAAAMCAICRLRRPCGKAEGSCDRRQAQRKPVQKPEGKFEKTHPAPADGSIEIYVGNLSYDLTEDQLRKEFEAFGKVNSARIITNRYNGKSKGFGFVQMPNREEAEKAVAALNDKDFMGRRMKCNEAKNLI